MSIKIKPLVLVILDGWGIGGDQGNNAIAAAQTPNIDGYLGQYPNTTLEVSGETVGLPAGQMGNSEVGHLNMGAGRVVYQDLTRINRSIKQGNFFTNEVLLQAIKQAITSDRSLHLLGLLSDGGVHSHIEHLFALLELAQEQGLKKIYIHSFLDGRDVPPANAMQYIDALEEKCAALGIGQVATVMGRYYAMDRDQRWDRIAKAYRAMVLAEGHKAAQAKEAVEASYRRDETDEFMQPTVIVKPDGQPVATIKDGDTIIFYNFRPDRARQITRAFVDQDFVSFERPAEHPTVNFICMTQYDKTIPAPVAFKPNTLPNTLGQVLSQHNIKQLRLAETEKYAHVTFFFNGGVEEPNPGEERILIPSPQVATYDLKPEMSAGTVTETLLTQLQKDHFEVVIMNYANPDMVGHTGKMAATVKAIETVDHCVGQVVQAVLDRQGTVLITADHGNAEQMKDAQGKPITCHTTQPVPFILVNNNHYQDISLRSGRLEDIAPTMLEIIKIAPPSEMTGRSLILRDHQTGGRSREKDIREDI